MNTPALKSFVAATARPLPVILLADVSGSMYGAKIQALNVAMADMIQTFRDESTSRAEIHAGVITFGELVELHLEPTPASQVALKPMFASGSTPMGAAFAMAKTLLEDTQKISGRAYTPALVLMSDGQPTDAWEAQLSALLTSPRAAKAQRFALSIGADADRRVLERFLNNPEARVFEAHEANQIRNFFRFVTMSVTARSKSVNPNQSVILPASDLDDLL